MKYPKTDKKPFVYEIAGHSLADDYQWLEDRAAPETLEWVAKQNEFTDEWFKNIGGIEKRAEALKDSTPRVQYSVCAKLNGKLFALRADENNEYAAVILDGDFAEKRVVASRETFDGKYHIGSVLPCPSDNGLIALMVQPDGAVTPSCLIYDYVNGRELIRLDKTFSFVWDAKDRLFCAAAEPDPASGVNRTGIDLYDPASDSVKRVFEYQKHSPFLMLSIDREGRWLLIECWRDYAVSEVVELDCETLRHRFITGEAHAKYAPAGSRGGYHYLLTDYNAPLGSVIALKTGSGVVAQSALIIPGSARMMQAAKVTERGILVLFMEDAKSCIELYSFDGTLVEKVALPDACGTAVGAVHNRAIPLKGEELFYFEFESFTHAPATYSWNERTGEFKKEYQARDVHVPDDIVTTQIFVPARDGERVPAFIVHKKDILLDGSSKALMFGYGGFAYAMTPVFTNPYIGMDIYKWVELGGIYVNCNLRGGNEYGSKWQRAGNLHNKKNAFFDFIDTAEWLIANGWAKPGNIGICGASNGGLLMTALTTMRPDLWGCVIASVPHTDMIRFVNDDRGPMNITEYGDPRNPAMFDYLYSYSPYHNIRAADYPPIYVQTGELDNNVPPYHGKKFAARMQELNRADNPALLRVLARGSHDRGTGDEMYRTYAEMQAFLMKHLGIDGRGIEREQ